MSNGRILQEKTGSDITGFEYDSNGQLVSMKYNGVVYYLFNLQGDVVGLLDSSGNVAMTYAWDAWGNNIVTFGMSESGEANPFVYRGYYQDTETGLYYLNSRYYSAEWGRFLNADAQINEGILGTNLFAYCNNDPVNCYDPDGRAAIWITDSKTLAGLGHSSLLIEYNGNWYYFYFSSLYMDLRVISGPSNVALEKLPKDVVKNGKLNLGALNKFANNLSGKKAYKGTYNKSIFIKGNFNYSYHYTTITQAQILIPSITHGKIASIF